VGFWRTEDPVLEDGRVVKGGMWPHQREWWELKNFVRMLVSGYGGGKTLQMCKWGIASALHNAPAPVAIVSPTFPMARETVIATTSDLLNGKSTVTDLLHGYNKQEHVFTIQHGARRGRLIIYSGEDPNRLKGPNLAAAGMDEPFIQDVEVFKQIVARVRHPAARRREIVLTGTPEGMANWGYELAEGDLRQSFDVGMVQASTRANLALSDDYAGQLDSQYAEKERASYVEGQFVNMSTGLVYYAFDPARNLVTMDRPAGTELGVGMDFGSATNHESMAGIVFWTDGHRMHVFDEESQANSDTPSMCLTLRGRHGAELVDVYPDASGQARQSASGDTDYQALRDLGMSPYSWAANPARRERYNRVNAMLADGRLTIDPGCRKLRRFIQGYTHESMHKQKSMSHLLDALGYPVCYLFPAADPHIHTVRIM